MSLAGGGTEKPARALTFQTVICVQKDGTAGFGSALDLQINAARKLRGWADQLNLRRNDVCLGIVDDVHELSGIMYGYVVWRT